MDQMNALNKDQFFKKDQIKGWPLEGLRIPLSDYWPANLIKVMYYRIERINSMQEPDRSGAIHSLSADLKPLLDNFPIITNSQDIIVKKLSDLLNLPIWQRRHELYSAWMLTNIEKSLDSYSLKVHHTNGVLKMPFSPTKLITAESSKGTLLLYSEMRTLVNDLISKKRKRSIQPDYTIFLNDTKSGSALAVIEVKQYRKPSNSNFGEAIKDYSVGHKHAHIFLVNYGKVSPSLQLHVAQRNTAVGDLLPRTLQQTKFIKDLRAELPPPILPSFIQPQHQQLILDYRISELWVDVSGSMLQMEPDQHTLSKLLNGLISCGQIREMTAVDQVERKKWNFPDSNSVIELLKMDKDSGTSLIELLPQAAKLGIAVITDNDGENELTAYKGLPYLLMIIKGREKIEFKFINDELS